jgi:hypothetical protein
MYAAEFDAFKQTLTDLCVAVNRPVNDDLVRVFWDDLRPCSLPGIQEHAKKLRREGKTKFTSADLRPQMRPANSFEEPSNQMDHFARFGNKQLFKLLWLFGGVPADVLPVLIKRKDEIIDAARHDPEMQVGGDEAEQGRQLHEILFGAWCKALSVDPKLIRQNHDTNMWQRSAA